jgi:hypothetical protein
VEASNLTQVIVHEKVKDHAKWLKGFQNDAVNRKGSMGGVIYQLVEDPNQHYIVFEWDDEAVLDFINLMETPMMKKVFREAGVIEQTFKLCSPTTKFEK